MILFQLLMYYPVPKSRVRHVNKLRISYGREEGLTLTSDIWVDQTCDIACIEPGRKEERERLIETDCEY